MSDNMSVDNNISKKKKKSKSREEIGTLLERV